MSHIFLVRHGEVVGNSLAAGGRLTFAGWHDKPLTPRGEEQAQAVAQRLLSEKLTTIYCSDLQRARITAEKIAACHNAEVRVDARLRELNYGAWEGLGLDEILASWADIWEARQADPENVATPDGENYADLWRRLSAAWNDIIKNVGEDERIAIVAHNGTIRILLCRLLGMPLANFKRIQTSNCGLTHIEIKSAKIEYSKSSLAPLPEIVAHFINDTNHLKEL